MLLRWLISTIGLAALKGEVTARAARAGRRAALYALIVILWLMALGFAIAAFTVWLASLLGAIAACAIIAGGLTVIGLAIQIALMLTGRRKPPGIRLSDLAPPPTAAAAESGGIVGSLAIVAIVGWLLGRRMGK